MSRTHGAKFVLDSDQAVDAMLSREEVRNVDRRAIEEYGLPGIVLMENAGRGAAELLLQHGIHGSVVICCGRGNNGGDGFVIARHLDLAGCDVRIIITCPIDELSGDARINAEVVSRSGIPITVLPDHIDPASLDRDLSSAGWIVDALLGTGTRGTIREPYDRLIAAINRTPAHVLAVDLPSGLDCDTGQPLGPCVRADLTATFVARKTGFSAPGAVEYLGQIVVVDIGVPRQLLTEFGIDSPRDHGGQRCSPSDQRP